MFPYNQSKAETEMIIHSLADLISNSNKIEHPEYKSTGVLCEELENIDQGGANAK